MSNANDELPDDVRDALVALARDPRRVMVSLKAWDLWVTVAVIQFATRNPHLSPLQREQATRVGRTLQGLLAELAPTAAPYLEAGWDPSKDVPREGGAE